MRRLIARTLLPLFAMTACGAAPELPESPASTADQDSPPGMVEQAVAALPESLEERAAELATLDDRFPDHPLVQAAIDDFNERTDRSAGLVHRAEVDGRTIKFYEPQPGVLLVSERGPLNQPMLVASDTDAGRGAVEAFRLLLPGEPIPEALIALDLRAGVPGRDEQIEVGSRLSRQGGEPTVLEYSPDPNVFRSEGGCPQTKRCGQRVFSACHPEWGGGIWYQARSHHAEWHVASYSGGAMNFRILSDGRLVGVWFIGAGERHLFNWNGPMRTEKTCSVWGLAGCTVSQYRDVALLRAEVVNAQNDGFHFGGIWWNKSKCQ